MSCGSVRVDAEVKCNQQYKSRCHFSKTGWAFVDGYGGCSCNGCPPPKNINEVWPDHRETHKNEISD